MDNEKYMRRALQLARLGRGNVSPNPMVGAVIVARGEIIGEGAHLRFGGPHAEVNAIRSVAPQNRGLLGESTIFVTLEPCSHYGKTPPCAKLIIDTGIPRVVIAAPDPNPKVNGRGIAMLRDAGIEVVTDVLKSESQWLNRRFITAQTLRRPYIQLKWAQSLDGIMGALPGNPRLRISTPLTSVWMHRQRSLADAILVGTDTVIADNPSLNCRLWPGRDPLPVTFDSPRLPAGATMLQGVHLLIPRDMPLAQAMDMMYVDKGISSLMAEGGTETLRRFIEAGLYDELRIETAPFRAGEGIVAPRPDIATLIAAGWHSHTRQCDGNTILTVCRPLP